MAGATFRVQKTDLQLRPIRHQMQERVEAHILVCFLAYVLWKTLGQMCQRARLGEEPRKVFQELADLTLVGVVLPTRNGTTIRKRWLNRPTQYLVILLQHLNPCLPISLECPKSSEDLGIYALKTQVFNSPIAEISSKVTRNAGDTRIFLDR